MHGSTISRGFVGPNGRAALRARSIEGLLPRMRDPRRLRADPRFAFAIFLCIVQKLRSEVCAAKASNGVNSYFAQNIIFNYTCTIIIII